jgi:hypothetical protein
MASRPYCRPASRGDRFLPRAAAFTANINYDQRIRHEGYDIESMMNAAAMTAPAVPSCEDTSDAVPSVGMRPRVFLSTIGMAELGMAAIAVSLLVAVPPGPHALAQAVKAEAAQRPGRWHDASLEDYRKHLVALEGLTRACAQGRDLKTCDPTLVGADDRVPLHSEGTERRIVRYGWLRILFSHAEEPDTAQRAPDTRKPAAPAQAGARPAPLATSQLLVDAEARLVRDLAQAGAEAASQPGHNQERGVMKEVLAGREFSNLRQAAENDTYLEKFGNWLNRFFEKFGKMRARSAWVGRVLVWGFFLVIGIALAWSLLQLERRWRVRLVPLSEGPAPTAASARDWQLWLTDARSAAAAGLWREAIHFVYWAAISRLESKRLWPADRARTPREYLSLVAPDDPRKAGLASLTGSFERTWYGGRKADESDYRRAEQLAATLISGSPRTELLPAEGRAE